MTTQDDSRFVVHSQLGGVARFAEVDLRVEEPVPDTGQGRGEEVLFVWSDVTAYAGGYECALDADEITAVETGVYEGMAVARSQGVPVTGALVRVLSVRILVASTDLPTLTAAAAGAVVQAFGLRGYMAGLRDGRVALVRRAEPGTGAGRGEEQGGPDTERSC